MTALESVDTRRLAELEQVISVGLQTFVEVGTALAEVRDARLYRGEHATFEDYCRERWNMQRAQAYRLIEAADVVASMSPMGDIPLPSSERQARELARVDPEQRAEVWQAVHEVTAGKPTAAAIRAVAALPAPTRPTVVDPRTGELLDAQDVVDQVSAAIATHCPGAAEDYALRQWRAKFMQAVTSSFAITRFDAEAVAEKADDELLDELRRRVRGFEHYVRRIESLRQAGAANVVRLERR